jgi:16S rRNA (cytosine967-C5)-methyltransferase
VTSAHFAHAAKTTHATPARLLALELTRQVRERKAYAHRLIEDQVRTADIPQAERDFATLLILGVVASSGELDYLLDRALTHGSIKANVRDALRISTYELFFLQKEAHVAVDQGVELVRSLAPQAAGFANKLLRATAQLRDDFPFGDPAVEIKALAHQQAFPLWLAERLVVDLGFESTAEFMAASNLQAPVFLADLPQGTTIQIAPLELSAWLTRIEAGELIIADASAQKAVALATSSTRATDTAFLEVGSGRGTKTVLLQRNALRTSGRQPTLFALDHHAFKHKILAERIDRYHLENVTPVTGDATQLDELIARGQLPQNFGGALIDVPCSGTGTLRRHPEIRWRLAPAEVMAMAAQGLEMLKAVAHHIECGGFVVYSTCSVFCEENEQVINAFLASDEGKSFVLDTSCVTSSAIPCVTANPLRTRLVPNAPDAHFAVRLIKACEDTKST